MNKLCRNYLSELDPTIRDLEKISKEFKIPEPDNLIFIKHRFSRLRKAP